MFPIELLGVKTNPAKSPRNLGVIFDKNFTFRSHISVVCNSCFYHMRDLRRIRRHLDLDSAKLLATALVSSRLDYCNSLLYGIADIDLTRLQRVQNQLARLVTKSPPFTHSIPLLRSLVLCLFGTTCLCLSVQSFQLLPLRNIRRHISLTWPFPHRYRYARWSVDVMELFPRFCC